MAGWGPQRHNFISKGSDLSPVPRTPLDPPGTTSQGPSCPLQHPSCGTYVVPTRTNRGHVDRHGPACECLRLWQLGLGWG